VKLPTVKSKSNPPSHLRLTAPALRLLVVDDEPSVLRAVKRALSTKRPSWIVVLAQGPAEAKERLECELFDVVVSDFEMPDMNGVELLKHAKRHQPSAWRIILSGLERRQGGVIPAGLLQAWLKKIEGPSELVRCCEELTIKRHVRRSSPKTG
jgi:CheY-like chemotaxis protein